jgi:cytochrome b subunit of formate dehydrogenase
MPLTKKDKEWMKKEVRDWAEHKYATVGRWTVNAVAVFIVMALCIMALELNGWTPPWSVEFIEKVKK